MREFVDSSDITDQPDALLARLRETGYLLVRGILPVDDVLDTRRDVLDALVQLGWSSEDEPTIPAGSPVPEAQWRDGGIALQSLESVHRLGNHERLRGLVHLVLPDAFPHPARVVRVVWPHRQWPLGEFVHQDWAVFRVPDMLTTWYPLGDVPRGMGPLRILSGSHRDGLIGRPWRGEIMDVETDDPRWRTGDIAAGDVILFHCLTVHTGTRNATRQFRLSMDVRWQVAEYPVPEVALWPHVDAHFAHSPTTATHPGWAELAAGWRSREPVQVPAGLVTFDHTSHDLPRDHPPGSRFFPTPPGT